MANKDKGEIVLIFLVVFTETFGFIPTVVIAGSGEMCEGNLKM